MRNALIPCRKNREVTIAKTITMTNRLAEDELVSLENFSHPDLNTLLKAVPNIGD
jgi:hypothetical protein